MDVKQAVALAKRYVIDLFGEEQVLNLGLEEVTFDPTPEDWLVTIGFSRPWDEARSPWATISDDDRIRAAYPRRSYKVVRISNDHETVLELYDRITPHA